MLMAIGKKHVMATSLVELILRKIKLLTISMYKLLLIPFLISLMILIISKRI